MQSNTSRQQFLRDILTLAKDRMLLTKTANETNATTIVSSTSSSLNTNEIEIVLGIGSICMIIALFIKILMQTIRKFEYYYMSPSYNRFGFIANEDSESESESESTNSDDNEDTSHTESLSSSPISLRPTLTRKCLHDLHTPLQKIKIVTPKTPLPLPPVRRSLRLKIKSELNLSEMEKNVNQSHSVTTRSQSRHNQNITVSSDPCPISKNRSSIMMTTPSPHPEHDEERDYYIRYCNEKKMRRTRPEFNSPIFIRRLVL